MHHNVGWETKNLNAQTRTIAILGKKIEKLEDENEQLRNSINRLISEGKKNYQISENDTRIQALIEENKRLLDLLRANKNSDNSSGPETSENVYAGKIAFLINENKKLKDQVARLSNNQGKTDYSIIDAYKEENFLLKEALNQRDNGAERIVLLQKQIRELKSKNYDLENKLADRSKYIADKDMLAKKNEEIRFLQSKVKNLQDDNKDLKSSISRASDELQKYIDRTNKLRAAYKNNLEALELLKGRISRVKKENKELQEELLNNKSNLNKTQNDQIAALKKQNKSLRETIKAQNEELISADNAVKTAERLLSENQLLKRNLESITKSSAVNSETTKDLIEHNKKLQEAIIQRDKYIKKLSGLKETVKMLREENDKLLYARDNDVNNENTRISDLLKQNNDLRKELNKEHENIVSYKNRIKEYQLKIKELSSDDKKSDFENKILNLNKKITSLSLENQDLKARIEILSKDKKSPVFHKADIYFDNASDNSFELLETKPLSSEVDFIRGKKEIIVAPDSKDKEQDNKIEEVTYVDTKYPPVNEVLPVLNQDGSHTDSFKSMEYSLQMEDMSKTSDASDTANIRSEDLLSKELTPLGSVK